MEDLGSDAEENYSDAEDTHQSPATSPEERSDDESQNQLSALFEAEVRDLFHLGCKCSGQNHYTALENQRETLIRLMTSLQDLDKKSSQPLRSGRTGSKYFTCHCCQRRTSISLPYPRCFCLR